MTAPLDLSAVRAHVDGFRGRFFYDAEYGDLACIAKDCDDCACDHPRNRDGDPDCVMSLDGPLDEHVGQPIAEMLNAIPALLELVEEQGKELSELRKALLHACSALDDAVQFRHDAEAWFPEIDKLRKAALPGCVCTSTYNAISEQCPVHGGRTR